MFLKRGDFFSSLLLSPETEDVGKTRVGRRGRGRNPLEYFTVLLKAVSEMNKMYIHNLTIIGDELTTQLSGVLWIWFLLTIDWVLNVISDECHHEYGRNRYVNRDMSMFIF